MPSVEKGYAEQCESSMYKLTPLINPEKELQFHTNANYDPDNGYKRNHEFTIPKVIGDPGNYDPVEKQRESALMEMIYNVH